MRIPTLLPFLDRLPSDPHTHLGLPAALAPHLMPMQRAARHPQPWVEYRLLAALALAGWSFRYSLAHADALAHGIDPTGGQYKRAFRQLSQAGLWEEARVRVTVHAVLVRLTPLGHSLLTKIGLTPVESEWVRMERLHRGDTSQQIRHTAAVCAFAYHARKRGYDTEVCPEVDGPAEPDILLTGPDETLYVKVQRQGGEVWKRAAKWRNLLRLQDEVILCTATPQQARRYAAEAQSVGADRGRLTDLATLLRYWTYILNYFSERISSGFVEGLNNKLKTIKQRCYGIKKVSTLFQRIWLVGLWVWKRRNVSVPAAVGFYVGGGRVVEIARGRNKTGLLTEVHDI